jgi:deoxyribose-phosphate aldolase
MTDTIVTSSTRTGAPVAYRRSLQDALELSHGVDAVAAEERAASLAKRSLKKNSKVWGLNLAISMIDLTTLEGRTPPGRFTRSARRRCVRTRWTAPSLMSPLSASIRRWSLM